MIVPNHIEDAKARLSAIERTATLLARGEIEASSVTMSGLAELARKANLHLCVAVEEARSA